MPRLVISNQDTIYENDKFKNAMCYKKGHVIAILETGQSLGAKGDINSAWTVIDVDGSIEDYSSLLISQQGDKLQNPMLGRRNFIIDIDGLLGVALTPVGKGTVSVPLADANIPQTVLTLASTDLLSYKIVAPIMVDPDILGGAVSAGIV